MLVLVILPQQGRLLAALDPSGGPGPRVAVGARRLTMAVGVFNLIWAVVTVLMIVRPGSTTGA